MPTLPVRTRLRRETYLDKSYFMLHFYEHGLSNIIFLIAFWNKSKESSTYLDLGIVLAYNLGFSIWNYSVKALFQKEFKNILQTNKFISKNQIIFDQEIKKHIIQYRNFEDSYNTIMYTITFNRSIETSKESTALISKIEQWREMIKIYYTYDDFSYIVGTYDSEKENYVLKNGTPVQFAGGDYNNMTYVGDGRGTHVILNGIYELVNSLTDETIYHKVDNFRYMDMENAIKAFKEITSGNEQAHLQLILRTKLPEVYPGILPLFVFDYPYIFSLSYSALYVAIRYYFI